MFLFQIRSEEELGFVRIIMTALNIIAIYLWIFFNDEHTYMPYLSFWYGDQTVFIMMKILIPNSAKHTRFLSLPISSMYGTEYV
jgi:hypothetical protein